MLQALFRSPELFVASAGRYRAEVMGLLDIQTIRLANLLLLLKECGQERGAAAKLSRLTGVPQPYISQLKNQAVHSARGTKRTMGDPTARALEEGMGKPRGWMDHDHSSAVTDYVLRTAAKIARLTPEQRQAIEQTTDVMLAANGTPPPDEGPELRTPKPNRH
jgi:hypothetical protein